MPIQAVSDPELVQKLQASIEGLVDKPWNFNVQELARRHWLAVPSEKGRHFDDPEAENTAKAMQVLGCRECFAVATEPVGNYPHCYSVPATKEGLRDFSDECAGLNFVLVPGNETFAVLCTSEDYNIHAGPPHFVAQALGADIQTARTRFREFASDEWWQGRLLKVAERYEQVKA